jgi:hypothetical protein
MYQETGQNSLMWSFMICAPHPILFHPLNKDEIGRHVAHMGQKRSAYRGFPGEA